MKNTDLILKCEQGLRLGSHRTMCTTSDAVKDLKTSLAVCTRGWKRCPDAAQLIS